MNMRSIFSAIFLLFASNLVAEEEPALPKKFDYMSKENTIAGVPIRIGLASAHPLLAEYRIWLIVEPKDKPRENHYLAWDTGGLATTYVSKTDTGSFIFWNGANGELLVDPATGKVSKPKVRDVEGWKKSLVGRFYWNPKDDTDYRFFTEDEFGTRPKKD